MKLTTLLLTVPAPASLAFHIFQIKTSIDRNLKNSSKSVQKLSQLLLVCMKVPT